MGWSCSVYDKIKLAQMDKSEGAKFRPGWTALICPTYV